MLIELTQCDVTGKPVKKIWINPAAMIWVERNPETTYLVCYSGMAAFVVEKPEEIEAMMANRPAPAQTMRPSRR